MVERQLTVRISADINAFQQAMAQAQSSLHSFQQSMGTTGQSVHGLQQASAQAGSAVGQIGTASAQAASATTHLTTATGQATVAAGRYRDAQGRLREANGRFVADADNATGAANRQGQAVNKAGDSFKSFARKAIAIVGIGAVFKSTIQAGADFQSSLNTLGAVSGATATKMKQVGDTARQLGNDISIPGASAATAAEAMTELAKGGLSVDQAMQAAKGTLQLAAAAQIDGAQAAEIQAKAINTFGLAGKDASHVGDVLANTANAASGEITDFAAALAQGGLVAHSMGISIDDTSTALGIFANQGLVGSDAGTSLKTMLVSLQSPTKQQTAALEQLGVKAFDAQGNFVGMRTVTDELSAAQKAMTQEQFAAAASTAFGTDAVRASIAVASGGPAAWDAMAASVSKAGGAAELAGAQTKGLKGAFGLVQNAVQDAQLALMDKLSPALEEGTKKLAGMIPSLTDTLVPALGSAGTSILGVAQDALPLLASAAQGIAPLFSAAASGIQAVTPILGGVVSVVGGIANVFAGMPGPVHAAVLAMLAMRAVRGPLGSVGTAASGLRTQLTLMGRQMSFLRFQGMGVAAAGMAVGLRTVGTAARTAGRGLMSAFGGPIGLAIIGITTALSFFSAGNQKAAEKIEEHKAKITELAETMDTATGKITEASKAAIRTDFGNVAPAFDAVKLNAGEAANAIIAMETDGGAAAQRFREKLVTTLDIGDIGRRLSASGVGFVDQFTSATGIAQEDILRIVAVGGKGLDDLGAKLTAAGIPTADVAKGFNRLRGDVENVSGVFSAFTGKQDQMAKSMGQNAAQVETARKSYADLAKVDFATLNRGLDIAAASGGTLEASLGLVGITGKPAADVIAKMGEAAHLGAGGMHYLTEEAAAASTAAADTGKAAEGAGGKITAAGSAADSWAKAVEDAKAPTDGLKGALDLTKAAADGVTTATDFMAAAILRANGVDISAEQAQRLNAAALRGVTEGIYEKVRAGEDDKKSTADRTQAEKDLAAARSAGRKFDSQDHANDETEAEFAKRIADLTDKVSSAKRTEQDAHLKNAAAQTADKEAYEKAGVSANEMALKAGMAALATGSVKDASKAAKVELDKQRDAYIGALVAAGKSRVEAEKTAKTYLATPKQIDTQFNALITEASKRGQTLFRVYDATNKTWTAQFLTKDDAAARLKAGDTVKAYDLARGTWTGNITAKNADALDKISATQAAVDGLTGTTVPITFTGTTGPVGGVGIGAHANIAAATGGYISGPGTGTSDSINAYLSDGEYVVNAKATAKHRPVLDQINRDVPAFATGGFFGRTGGGLADYNMAGSSVGAPDFNKMADTAIKKMAPSAGAALQAAMAKLALAGGAFTAGSGNWGPPNTHGLAANTLAAEKYVQSHFGINNIGGWSSSGSVATSDHPKGKAIDVMIANWQAAAGIARGNEVADYFTGHPNDFGTKYVIWRNQIDTGSGWRPYTRSDRGNNSDPTLAHMDHVHVSFLSGPSGPLAGAGGGGGGARSEAATPAGTAESRWYPLMHRVIDAKGFNQDVFPIMAKQMHMESSGRQFAINLTDSNARAGHPSKGILQFIDSTFRQYADPGFNTDIYDPESQIRAFLNYVPDRYPKRGFQHLTDIGNRAYAGGGLVVGAGTGTSDSINARLSNKEFVVNAKSTDQHLDLLHAINNGMPGFASGGLVGAGSLAGLSSRGLGEREGLTATALADLSAAIKDLRSASNDLARTAVESQRAQQAGVRDATAERIRGERRIIDARLAGEAAVAKATFDRDLAYQQARNRGDRKGMIEAARQGNAQLVQVKKQAAANLAGAQGELAESSKQSARRAAGLQKVAQADTRAAKAADARADAAERANALDARVRAQLIRYTQHADKAADALKTATDGLASLREQAAGIRSDSASKALGIGGGILGDSSFAGTITAKGVEAALKADLAKAKLFDTTTSKAKGLGLSGSLIDQLSDPSGRGGEVLAGLAKTGTAKSIASINSLISQISAVGTKTGQTRADALLGKAFQASYAQVKSAQIDVQYTDQQVSLFADRVASAQLQALKSSTVNVTIDGQVLRNVAKLEIRKDNAMQEAKYKGRR